MDKYQIEDSLVINMGQILTKYVPVNRSTLVKKCDKTATIKGNSDKRSINFQWKFFTYAANIYGGKTSKYLSRLNYPISLFLSYNKSHYSDERESCKLIEEILFPYFKKMSQNEDLLPDQRALIILDVLSG